MRAARVVARCAVARGRADLALVCNGRVIRQRRIGAKHQIDRPLCLVGKCAHAPGQRLAAHTRRRRVRADKAHTGWKRIGKLRAVSWSWAVVLIAQGRRKRRARGYLRLGQLDDLEIRRPNRAGNTALVIGCVRLRRRGGDRRRVRKILAGYARLRRTSYGHAASCASRQRAEVDADAVARAAAAASACATPRDASDLRRHGIGKHDIRRSSRAEVGEIQIIRDLLAARHREGIRAALSHRHVRPLRGGCDAAAVIARSIARSCGCDLHLVGELRTIRQGVRRLHIDCDAAARAAGKRAEVPCDRLADNAGRGRISTYKAHTIRQCVHNRDARCTRRAVICIGECVGQRIADGDSCRA